MIKYAYYLTPSRAIAYRPNRGRIKPFTGSSLLRTKSYAKAKARKAAKEEQEALLQVDAESRQSATTDLQGAMPPTDLRPKRKTGNNGFLSGRSRTKIRDKMQCFFNACPADCKRLVTLSFVGDVTDRAGVKCLDIFLKALRKKFGKSLCYIWVAERQTQTTGRVHFHLLLNQFLDVRAYNAVWTMIQYRQGINNPAHSNEQVFQAVKAGNLQKILNPFDIRKIHSQQGIQAYLTKYLTKLSQDAVLKATDKKIEPLKCRLWHCSKRISEHATGQQISLELFEETGMQEVNFSVNKRTDKVYTVNTFVHEYCLINTIYAADYFNTKLNELHILNQWIMKGMPPEDIPRAGARFLASIEQN